MRAKAVEQKISLPFEFVYAKTKRRPVAEPLRPASGFGPQGKNGVLRVFLNVRLRVFQEGFEGRYRVLVSENGESPAGVPNYVGRCALEQRQELMKPAPAQ